jgi:hypothetical protein
MAAGTTEQSRHRGPLEDRTRSVISKGEYRPLRRAGGGHLRNFIGDALCIALCVLLTVQY